MAHFLSSLEIYSFRIKEFWKFFLQTFSLHWKFTVSESRNFGFFFVSTFLSSKKRLIGFKEFWIFCGTFSLIIGNLQFQNQGILEFFLQTFSHHWNFTVSESRNFGFFFCKLSLIIGTLPFQNQGILDFFCLNFSLIQEKIDRI